MHKKDENHFVRKNAKKGNASSTSKIGASMKRKVDDFFSHGKSGDADSSDQVAVIACTTDKHRESDDKTSNGEKVDRKKKPRLSTSESDEES